MKMVVLECLVFLVQLSGEWIAEFNSLPNKLTLSYDYVEAIIIRAITSCTNIPSVSYFCTLRPSSSQLPYVASLFPLNAACAWSSLVILLFLLVFIHIV